MVCGAVDLCILQVSGGFVLRELHGITSGWWFQPSEKYWSVGSINVKIKHVPNRQPNIVLYSVNLG